VLRFARTARFRDRSVQCAANLIIVLLLSIPVGLLLAERGQAGLRGLPVGGLQAELGQQCGFRTGVDQECLDAVGEPRGRPDQGIVTGALDVDRSRAHVASSFTTAPDPRSAASRRGSRDRQFSRPS
jgi:hypothetical protein